MPKWNLLATISPFAVNGLVPLSTFAQNFWLVADDVAHLNALYLQLTGNGFCTVHFPLEVIMSSADVLHTLNCLIVFFYRAMLRQARLSCYATVGCLCLRLSVTLRHCEHICRNTSKLILLVAVSEGPCRLQIQIQMCAFHFRKYFVSRAIECKM